MCSGVVKVMTFPLIDAISLISQVGRSGRQNHDTAAGGLMTCPPPSVSYGPVASELSLSSWYCCCGQCMFQATRSPAHTLALEGKPVGVGCQKAPESSSNRTNLPVVKTLP